MPRKGKKCNSRRPCTEQVVTVRPRLRPPPGPASVPGPPSKQLLRAKPPAVLRLLTTQVIISTTSLHLGGREGRPLLERDRFRRWSLVERFRKKVEERAPLRIRAAGGTAAGNSGDQSRGLAPVTACMTLAGCLLFSGPVTSRPGVA